jgi:hypothetical protein
MDQVSWSAFVNHHLTIPITGWPVCLLNVAVIPRIIRLRMAAKKHHTEIKCSSKKILVMIKDINMAIPKRDIHLTLETKSENTVGIKYNMPLIQINPVGKSRL